LPIAGGLSRHSLPPSALPCALPPLLFLGLDLVFESEALGHENEQEEQLRGVLLGAIPACDTVKNGVPIQGAGLYSMRRVIGVKQR
jgi:hypothetical protein